MAGRGRGNPNRVTGINYLNNGVAGMVEVPQLVGEALYNAWMNWLMQGGLDLAPFVDNSLPSVDANALPVEAEGFLEGVWGAWEGCCSGWGCSWEGCCSGWGCCIQEDGVL